MQKNPFIHKRPLLLLTRTINWLKITQDKKQGKSKCRLKNRLNQLLNTWMEVWRKVQVPHQNVNTPKGLLEKKIMNKHQEKMPVCTCMSVEQHVWPSDTSTLDSLFSHCRSFSQNPDIYEAHRRKKERKRNVSTPFSFFVWQHFYQLVRK